MGGAWFAELGTRDSTGTKLLSVSGDCGQPGVYEVEYGITVDKFLELAGGENAQAVQMGGASGRCLAPKDFGRSISFEDLTTGGSVMVIGPQRDLLECVHQFVEFFVEESCGWCVPCRAGTTLLLMKLTKVLEGRAGRQDLRDLKELGRTIKSMSRCGLGQTAANPVLTTIDDFADCYVARIKDEEFVPPFDLEQAMKAGCEAAGRKMEGVHV